MKTGSAREPDAPGSIPAAHRVSCRVLSGKKHVDFDVTKAYGPRGSPEAATKQRDGRWRRAGFPLWPQPFPHGRCAGEKDIRCAPAKNAGWHHDLPLQIPGITPDDDLRARPSGVERLRQNFSGSLPSMAAIWAGSELRWAGHPAMTSRALAFRRCSMTAGGIAEADGSSTSARVIHCRQAADLARVQNHADIHHRPLDSHLAVGEQIPHRRWRPGPRLRNPSGALRMLEIQVDQDDQPPLVGKILPGQGQEGPWPRLTKVISTGWLKQGWVLSNRLRRPISATWFTGAPQFRALASWTLIFSVANHSTPLAKPKAPDGAARAHKAVRIRAYCVGNGGQPIVVMGLGKMNRHAVAGRYSQCLGR